MLLWQGLSTKVMRMPATSLRKAHEASSCCAAGRDADSSPSSFSAPIFSAQTSAAVKVNRRMSQTGLLGNLHAVQTRSSHSQSCICLRRRSLRLHRLPQVRDVVACSSAFNASTYRFIEHVTCAGFKADQACTRQL